MKKQPVKYPAFVHLNGAVHALQKAYHEDGELGRFDVKLEDGTVVTADCVFQWFYSAIEHFEKKVGGYVPPHREGFGPGTAR